MGSFFSVTGDGLDQFTRWPEDLKLNGHLPDGMCRTGKTWVIGPNGSFNAVEHTLGYIRSVDIGFGNTIDGIAHGPVIVAGGDDQVDF